MSRIYPYVTAIVMSDEIFADFGGSLLDTTPAQRSTAYAIAEEWACEYINTLLTPTIITGTYFTPHVGSSFQLDWMRLSQLHRVGFIDNKGTNYYSIVGTSNYYVAVRNSTHSIIDLFYIFGNCHGCGNLVAPYHFEVVYTAGLPTEVGTSNKVKYALKEASDLIINEMRGYGNESVGLVGVQEFSNQEYKERRTSLIKTVFGSSSKAQYIANLLDGLRVAKVAGL